VAVRAADEFENRLSRFLYERSEEARAVRVGEKETSEQAAIVARYADLFTRAQHEALRAEEARAPEEERERLSRLRQSCSDGIVAADIAEVADGLENAILAHRLTFQRQEMPLRTAQARLAVLDGYAEREALGELAGKASALFNGRRYELLARAEALEAELSGEPDPVARSCELKRIDLFALAEALDDASSRQDETWKALREHWLDTFLGEERAGEPTSSHISWLRRLSPLADLYTRERSVPVCLETLARLGFDLAANSRIRLDLDDRPQKNPRACVIASDPPHVVHLITRALGGLHDYQALLHEAGHALHYAGCDEALPYAYRKLARDHALTEIYSFLLESVTREAGWHAAHFDLPAHEAEDRAEAARFLELLLFRRYAAKLRYELQIWADFENAERYADTYASTLRAAIGFRYRPDGYLADMDDGFYSADYLRAWIRTAQVRAYLRQNVGADWWERPETGEYLSLLFLEGTRPSSEDIAARIGFEPLDTRPLLSELVVAG
jgi:hypothetical protein